MERHEIIGEIFCAPKKSRKINAHKHRFYLMREKASSQKRIRKAWKKPKNDLATIMLLCDENRILENPGETWNATKSQQSLFEIKKSYNEHSMFFRAFCLQTRNNFPRAGKHEARHIVSLSSSFGKYT